MKFGAFIVTYNRPEVLASSIRIIESQTVPPDVILIVDNSEQNTAQDTVARISSSRLVYIPRGRNEGPAGAAYFALQWLRDKGFDWAYWGDDDNPPEIDTTFERMFAMVHALGGKVGIAGAVGQSYNFRTGHVVRLKDEALKGYLDVDVMAGASYMLINLGAVGDNVLPDPRLFFGFEEFDFCLKMKRAGYSLKVDGDLMRDYRIKYDRLHYERRGKLVPDRTTLWRQYYSTRNLIHIFLRNQPGYRHIAAYRIFAAMGKIIAGFRNGVQSGFQNARYQAAAIVDGLTGRMGKKNF